MAASIRTTLYQTPGGAVIGPILTDTSRDDLYSGYQVKCESVFNANTYAWTLAYTPDSAGPASGSGSDYAGTPSSASLLSPEGSTSKTCKFNIDWTGSYLIRLVVDAGLPTESTMFLRLRALTTFGALKLVAAGERRDQTGVVPADASAKGWAEDANQNTLRLLAFVRRMSMSGRVLYVDANRGRDNSADQNDPENIIRLPGPDSLHRDNTGIRTAAIGFADFSSINDAIAYAQAAVSRGEPALSHDNPYIIRIAPGLYEENLNVPSNIYLIARDSGFHGVLPLFLTGGEDINPHTVRIRTVTGGLHTVITSQDDPAYMRGILLESYLSGEAIPYVLGIFGGSLFLDNVNVVHWAGGSGIAKMPDNQVTLICQQCHVYATGPEAISFTDNSGQGYFMAINSHLMSDYCTVRVNGEGVSATFQYCILDGNECIQGMPKNLEASFVEFRGDIDISWNPQVNYNAEVELNYCNLNRDMKVVGGSTTGTVNIEGSATCVQGSLDIFGANVTQTWHDVMGASAGGVTSLPIALAIGYTYDIPDDKVVVKMFPPGTPQARLPATPADGRYIVVKDASGTAAASVFNHIMVVAQGGDTIQGAPNYTISTNYGTVSVVYSASDATWYII